MSAAPTPTQLKVLRFMHAFYLENDQLPPMHVIAQAFGWRSANAAHEHCRYLQAKGLLTDNALGHTKFTDAGRALAGALLV